MGKKRIDERTLKMMENFMDDHNDGLTLKEISSKYGVSYQTVLNRLDEIAVKNNVSRESLLERVMPSGEARKSVLPVTRLDTSNFEHDLKSAIDSADEFMLELGEYIEKEKKECDVL